MKTKRNPADVDNGGEKETAQTNKGGRIETVALSTVYTAITITHLDKWMVGLLIVCDALQLLHFSSKSNYIVGGDIEFFFNSIGAITKHYSTFQKLFYIAFAAVLLNVVMIVAIGARLHRGQIRSAWPLKLLQILSLVFKTVLLIPIMNIFVTGVNCNYNTEGMVQFPKHQCLSESLFLYIGSIIGLCIIVPYNLLSAVTFLDARPSPKHFYASQAQGQTDTAYSAVRMALVFVHVLSSGSNGSAYISLICNILAFGYLAYLYSTTLPFYTFILNSIRTGFCIGIILSSISGIISVSVLADETTALIGQLVTAAIGFGFGFFLPPIIRQRIIRNVYARIKEELDSQSQSTEDVKHSDSKGSSNTVQDSIEYNIALVTSSNVDLIANTRITERPPIFQCETDVEIACRFVRHNSTADGKGFMHFIFRSGLQQYPKSGFLHATYAFYINEFDPENNKHARKVVRQCPHEGHARFSDRALLIFIQRALETALRTGNIGDDNDLSISSFAEFQSLEASARLYHTQTLEELRAFWSYLSSNNVTARALPVYVQKILQVERQGDEYYKRMIARFPKSKIMLRMYATWLQQVKNDPNSANNFFELANQIENNDTSKAVQQLEQDEDTTDIDGESFDGEDENVVEIAGRTEFHGPDLSLMKKASRSLILSGDLHSSFRLRSNSLADFNANSTNSINRPSNVKRTATLEDEKAEERYKAISAPEVPKAEVEEKIRHDAFLEPDDVQQSNVSRNVMIPETINHDVKGDQVEMVKYTGPKSESNASSVANSKAGAKRALRTQLEFRLTTDIHTFAKWIIGVTLAFLLLAICSYIVAIGQFLGFDNQLVSVKQSTRLAIRAVLLSQNLREQLLAARDDDEAAFNIAKKEFADTLQTWKIEQLPFLQNYYINPYTIRGFVPQLPNGTGQYIWVNEYGAGTAILQNGLQMLNMSMKDFADPDIINNNYFRFFGVPNTMALTSPIDMLSGVSQEAFILASQASMSQLFGLLAMVTLTVIASGMLVFYPMIKKTGATQVKVMKLFTAIPKKACRQICTNVEEDLENFIATGDEHEIQLANEAKLRVMAVLSGDISSQSSNRKFLRAFAMWLMAILCFNIVIFIPPVLFEIDGVAVVKTVNYSERRRYKVGTSLRLALELACHDDITFLDYHNTKEVLAALNDQIDILEDANELITTNHGNNGETMEVTPSADPNFLPDITNIGENCLLATSEACDPANRVYNSSIGLTQEMMFSGLDNIMNGYIDAARRLAGTDPATLDVHNRYYRFMRGVLEDVRGGLMKVSDALVAQQTAKISLYVMILQVFFSGTLVVIICSYFAFRLISQNRILEMQQIIQLLFSIPNNIMEETPQLSKYIQSGGLLGMDDNQ